jgi:hypothetical protein
MLLLLLDDEGFKILTLIGSQTDNYIVDLLLLSQILDIHLKNWYARMAAQSFAQSFAEILMLR